MNDAATKDGAGGPAAAGRSIAPGMPLWRTYLLFLLPMMAANILQALSGTLNNVYLGQMIGVHALAAVSVMFPIIFFFISFIVGLGAGSSVLIGQAWGAKEPDKVKAVAGTALTVTLIGGIVVGVLGSLFAGSLLRALNTPADILVEATAYARVMMIAMAPLLVFLLLTAMMRGVSDTITPFFALMFSTVIGLALTPALIRGWLGLPQLGATSAAVAGLVAYTAALVWLVFYMRYRKHPLAVDAVLLRHMKVDPVILRKVLMIGLPAALQMIVVSLAEMVLLGLVNSFGSDATAAYGAVNQVLSYAQFPALSIAITGSILAAQAIGAGNIERIGAVTRTGMAFNVVLTGGLIALAYLFSRSIVGMFITRPEVVDLAQTLLHLVLWSVILYGMAALLSAVMRASGTVVVPTLLAIAAIVLVEVPVAYGLSHRIGVNGVWYGYPAAFGAMLVMQSAYYHFVWRKKTIVRLI
jgi:putative MATE family efflux protein